MQAQGAGARREGPPEDLGGERGAAHAEQHDVRQAVLMDPVGEAFDLQQLVEHPFGDPQPAEAVRDLRRAGRTPQRRVFVAQAICDLLPARCSHELPDHRPHRRRDAGLDGEVVGAHATIVVAAALL